MGRRKRWDELTEQQQRFIVVAGVVEMALTVATLFDLARRRDEQVRGSRAAWALAAFVQPFGPVSYLMFGRRGSCGSSQSADD